MSIYCSELLFVLHETALTVSLSILFQNSYTKLTLSTFKWPDQIPSFSLIFFHTKICSVSTFKQVHLLHLPTTCLPMLNNVLLQPLPNLNVNIILCSFLFLAAPHLPNFPLYSEIPPSFHLFLPLLWHANPLNHLIDRGRKLQSILVIVVSKVTIHQAPEIIRN